MDVEGPTKSEYLGGRSGIQMDALTYRPFASIAFTALNVVALAGKADPIAVPQSPPYQPPEQIPLINNGATANQQEFILPEPPTAMRPKQQLWSNPDGVWSTTSEGIRCMVSSNKYIINQVASPCASNP
jgi:hypothetical protein